jgi:hypothetical protein
MWRIEWALWVCYWNAINRDDQFSIHYCANRSLLVFTFWLVVLMCGIFALGTVIRFLQDVVP